MSNPDKILSILQQNYKNNSGIEFYHQGTIDNSGYKFLGTSTEKICSYRLPKHGEIYYIINPNLFNTEYKSVKCRDYIPCENGKKSVVFEFDRTFLSYFHDIDIKVVETGIKKAIELQQATKSNSSPILSAFTALTSVMISGFTYSYIKTPENYDYIDLFARALATALPSSMCLAILDSDRTTITKTYKNVLSKAMVPHKAEETAYEEYKNYNTNRMLSAEEQKPGGIIRQIISTAKLIYQDKLDYKAALEIYTGK